MSPLHPLKIRREEFAITLEGVVADTPTIVFGLYQPLSEVEPPFEFTESKYCVA